jgi:hypothetical protein
MIKTVERKRILVEFAELSPTSVFGEAVTLPTPRAMREPRAGAKQPRDHLIRIDFGQLCRRLRDAARSRGESRTPSTGDNAEGGYNLAFSCSARLSHSQYSPLNLVFSQSS